MINVVYLMEMLLLYKNKKLLVMVNSSCYERRNEVTLKTFYKEKDHVRLQPENDSMEPIILTEVSILGKAIGLYRKI